MYKRYFKRLLDLVLALLVLPFWLLMLAVIAPIIYIQDKGTPFYNAPRLGKDGKVFKMYKFRSMKLNAPDLRNEDGSTFNSENDPRLTSIGKFIRKTSLDETPQLLNIIKGDMSILGPRPDLPDHMNLYEGNEVRKLEVRPGVSGYNQAYFRNTVPWKDRIKNDIYYIDNLTFLMDIKVFFKTAISVLGQKDVFVEKTSNSKES
ncbi:sugar transferase [Chryseomicrobium aureum]|uniref:sugar transferase n=1 Tax=Chryseomicrobium aureum TaxID=1441723 RepID=UPI001956A847|nr:sugar transferase [Chryseomicrobium aureum]